MTGASGGAVIALPEFRDKLFVTTKVDQVGKDLGVKQFRDALRNYQRDVIDLAACALLVYVEAVLRQAAYLGWEHSQWRAWRAHVCATLAQLGPA